MNPAITNKQKYSYNYDANNDPFKWVIDERHNSKKLYPYTRVYVQKQHRLYLVDSMIYNKKKMFLSWKIRIHLTRMRKKYITMIVNIPFSFMDKLTMLIKVFFVLYISYY